MKLISIFILLFWVVPLEAQNIVITDSKSGNPIEGVMVNTEGFDGLSDKQGNVLIPKRQANTKISFRHSSYINFKTNYKNLWAQNYKVQLVEDPVRLDEIVISANRRQQSKMEVPNKIISIQKDDIELQNVQTAADLLAIKGGVFMQKSQMGGGSPMIRGFSANRLLLVVDGVRMNNAIYRNGNLHNVISLDAGSIEHTEIIFGPGSVMYGSGALGGVIHFQTIRPKLKTSKGNDQSANFFTRYSSANFEKTIHADYNFGSEKWGGLISLTYADYDDLWMGTNGPNEYLRPEYVIPGKSGIDKQLTNTKPRKQIYSGYKQLNYMHKLRFRPHDKLELNYAYHYSTTSDIPRYDRLIQYNGDDLKYAEWYYGPQQWRLHSAELDYQNSIGIFDRAKVIMAWQSYKESRNSRKFNKVDREERTEEIDIFSMNIDMDKQLGENQFLYYGIEANHNLVHSNGRSIDLSIKRKEVIPSRYPDGSKTSNLAGYLSYKLSLNNKFTFQTGTRYSLRNVQGEFDLNFYDFPVQEFNSNHSALTGNIELVFHPTINWQINAIASTGFRSPNIDDIAKVFDSEPGNVVVPNPNLKPEKAKNIEIGILRRYENRAKFELNLFYCYLDDAMVRRDFTLNGSDSIMYDGQLSKVEALVNADYAHIYGGSINFDLIFNSHLRNNNSFTATFGEDSEGLPVRHVAPLFGTSHLVYSNRAYKLDLYLNYNGEIPYSKLAPSESDKPYLYAIDKDGNPYSPSWYTLNMKTSWQLSKAIQLNIGLENILNKRYRSYSSGIVAPGRNLIVSFRVEV